MPRQNPPNPLDEMLERVMTEVIFPRMEMLFDSIFPQHHGDFYTAQTIKKKKKKMRVNPVANPPRPSRDRRGMPKGYRVVNHRVTHYDTLQVSPRADQETIHAAWRSLCMRFHPDKRPGDARAVEMTKRLNLAWEVLGDPQKRAAYDRSCGI